MYIVSSIPGRLRARLNSLYRNIDFAKELYYKLYSINDIYYVNINVYTGKLLIVYDSKNMFLDDILALLKSCSKSNYKDNKLSQLKNKQSSNNTSSNDNLNFLSSSIGNSSTNFFDRISPILIILAVFYSIKTGYYRSLFSIIFILMFNTLKKSTSLAIKNISRKLINSGVSFINLDKLEKLSLIDVVVIDKTLDVTEIQTSFIESLREHGILDIYILTNNYNIENQANDLDLKVYRHDRNDIEIAKFKEAIKSENTIVALINRNPSIQDFYDDFDIRIILNQNHKSLDYKYWDLVISNNNSNYLIYILDFTKYAIEKIYQNQLLSLSISIMGIIISFNKGINLLYTWLLLIVNELLIYLNSLKILNYEPIYI